MRKQSFTCSTRSFGLPGLITAALRNSGKKAWAWRLCWTNKLQVYWSQPKLGMKFWNRIHIQGQSSCSITWHTWQITCSCRQEFGKHSPSGTDRATRFSETSLFTQRSTFHDDFRFWTKLRSTQKTIYWSTKITARTWSLSWKLVWSFCCSEEWWMMGNCRLKLSCLRST